MAVAGLAVQHVRDLGGDLGAEEHDVRAEVDPEQQRDHAAEGAVDEVVVAEVREVEREAELDRLEADGRDERARPEVARVERAVGEQPVEEEEGEEADQAGDDERAELPERRELAEDAEVVDLGLGDAPGGAEQERAEEEQPERGQDREVDELAAEQRTALLDLEGDG